MTEVTQDSQFSDAARRAMANAISRSVGPEHVESMMPGYKSEDTSSAPSAGMSEAAQRAYSNALRTTLGDADAQYVMDMQAKQIGINAKPKAEQPTPAAVAEPPKERSALEDIGRQLGLAVRNGIAGAASLPAMASDAITGPINAGLDAVLGQGHGFRFQKAEHALENVMTAAGLPTPENATERVVGDAVKGGMSAITPIGAGAALAKAAGPVAARVGGMLAAGPGAQVLSGAAGSGAASIAHENDASPTGEAIAGLAGALAPTALPYALTNAGKAIIRGGGEATRQRMADNIKLFEDAAGVTPTLAQATQNRAHQNIEAGLARTPLASGVMAKVGKEQSDAMASKVKSIVDELAPNGGAAADAGETIADSAKLLKTNMRTLQDRLYTKLDTLLPAETRIDVGRTRQALADLNSDIAGAPALSQWFKNARIQGIEGALGGDTGGIDAVLSRPGMADKVKAMRESLEQNAANITAKNAERQSLGMRNLEAVPTPKDIDNSIKSYLESQVDSKITYEALKKLRTLVGAEIENGSLVADVPRSKWKALYGALSQDLGDAAKAAGPQADKVWRTANRLTSERMAQLEKLDKIVGRDTPEKVFAAAMSGTAEGDTTLRRVINMTPMSKRGDIVGAVLQKMGRALPGQQDSSGQAFSSERFLTNLAAMSPQARETLFERTGVKGLKEKIDALGQMAAEVRAGRQVMPNPSGTAAASAQIAAGSALAGSVLHAASGGGLTPLVASVGIPVIGYGAAKAATHPGLVQHLATPTELPKAIAPIAVNQAAQIATPRTPSIADIGQAQNIDQAIAAASGAVQGSRQPSFVGASRPDGTFAIAGDPTKIRAQLQAAGLGPGLIVRGGILVGRSQADAAAQLFGR